MLLIFRYYLMCCINVRVQKLFQSYKPPESGQILYVLLFEIENDVDHLTLKAYQCQQWATGTTRSYQSAIRELILYVSVICDLPVGVTFFSLGLPPQDPQWLIPRARVIEYHKTVCSSQTLNTRTSAISINHLYKYKSLFPKLEYRFLKFSLFSLSVSYNIR